MKLYHYKNTLHIKGLRSSFYFVEVIIMSVFENFGVAWWVCRLRYCVGYAMTYVNLHSKLSLRG